MYKVHLASQLANKSRTGVFPTKITACGVWPEDRVATFEKSKVTCLFCSGKNQHRGRAVGTKIHRSNVVDQPGHPVAAPCAIDYCKHFELTDALEAIYSTVRGNEKEEFWTIRKYLDERGIFNADLGITSRLIAAVCEHALHKKRGG